MEKELYISSNPASGPNSTTRTEPFVKIIALVATPGGLLFGYDTGVVSGALLFMRGDLHLTPLLPGWSPAPCCLVQPSARWQPVIWRMASADDALSLRWRLSSLLALSARRWRLMSPG